MRAAVLDYGYVELVESWGGDERIIEAARMSTAKGFQGWGTSEAPGDEKLLRYLYEHKHHTPFEMAGFAVEVQAPIFVFREWHRHRTQSYNELSARYTQLPDLFYVPSIERVMASKQSAMNKQGSAEGFTEKDAIRIRSRIDQAQQKARKTYEGLLADGVAREVARVVVPVSQYSRMRASANLRNWLQFLTLRMAENAQWEIRQYANAVAEVVRAQFPRTWSLFAAGA
jgi:thymidylate synthase (FAD)